MNTFTSRKVVMMLIFASLALPLFAHHGAQFLSTAMESNAAEVQLAEMAVNKTQNPKVKDFAQMLAQDHKATLVTIQELRDMRMAVSVPTKTTPARVPAADVKLTPEHQRVSQNLSKLTGADFDREFILVMVQIHRQAIRNFETQAHAHGATSSTPQGGAGHDPGAHQKPEWEPRKYTRDELTRDVDTSDFAEASLPSLRHHLDMAMQIQKGLPTK